MPDYRRNRVPGGCYFFTVNLLDRRSDLLVTHIERLRASISRVRALRPFHIGAWVVLPDHMHAIWTLPDGDVDYPGRWQAIKMAFSKTIDPAEPLCASRKARRERGIWRRFWEHTIRDERDYSAPVDYVHFNPAKHGLVASVVAWPYSTFHRAIAEGRHPGSWGIDASDDGPKGERSGRGRPVTHDSRSWDAGAMPKRIAPYACWPPISEGTNKR